MFAPAMLSGCGPDLLYLPSLAIGQSEIVLRSVRIDDALTGDTIADDIRAKLELIREVRDYAHGTMRLDPGQGFRLFYDNTDGTRTYNVSASYKDRLEPVTWTFPIVGTLPYLGFFDRDRAEHHAETLREDGYDVFMYEVDAYSTLNFLPNPVQATMLERGEISIVDTVIHEILHSTIWRTNDTTFNESLATFFGRSGTVDFYLDRSPDHPEMAQAATERFEDVDLYNAFIIELHLELEMFFSSDASSEGKIAGRAEIVQAARARFATQVQPLMHTPEAYDWVADLPVNNAWMLANYRYNFDLDLFARVHDANDRDWPRSIDVFATAADSSDPKRYLRNWLDAREGKR